MRQKPMKSVVSSILTVLAVGGILFMLWFWCDFRESVYCHRGSLDFYRGITTPVIKRFPIIEPVTDYKPLYHYGCGDGEKLPDQSLGYRSRLSAVDLYPKIATHAAKYGYMPTEIPTNFSCFFTNGANLLFMAVTPESTNTAKVKIELTFR